jgi:hypothetical protein
MDLLNHLKNRAKGITLSILAVGLFAMPAIKECNNQKLTDLSNNSDQPAVVSHEIDIPFPIKFSLFQRDNYRINLEEKLNLDMNNKEIYKKYNQENLVDVSYREFCKSTIKGKGEIKELSDRIILSYKFVDVEPNEK